jgi:hypothetical protein
MTQTTPRRITATYAYHPADDVPDLVLPTEVIGHYVTTSSQIPLRGHFGALEHSLATNGVLQPLRIHTDGVSGVLTDGHHRYRIGAKLNITEMPLQVIPDNMRRMSARYGRPALEPHLAEWVIANLWSHDGHDPVRHKVGDRSTGGTFSNSYLRVVCSCGSTWKEEA